MININTYIDIHAYRQGGWINGEIILVSDLDGSPKLYEFKDDEFKVLTPDLDRVTGYRKDLKNKIIFPIHDVNGNERWYITGIDIYKGEKLFTLGDGKSINIPGEAYEEEKIIPYATNRSDPRLFEVYIYNYGTGEEYKIFGPYENIYPIQISPDGDKLVISMSNATWEQNIYVVDVETGEVIDSIEYPDTHFSSIQWIDNEKLYLVTDYNSDKRYIAEYTLNTSFEKILEEEYEIEMMKYRDGNLIYSVNVSGDSVIKIDDEEIKKPKGVLAYIDVDGEPLFSLNTVRYGESIWILKDGKLEPIKYCDKFNELANHLSEPKIYKTIASDGLEIESLVYKAKDSRGTIIYPHGGPESQSRPIYNPLIQVLVNNGYTVVQPNYRGSTGYGKRFRHLDDRRNRERSLKDIVEVLYDLSQKGVIEKDKTAVIGGSYGGFATLYLITHYPDLWRAAVSVVGISNLETFLRNTGPWRRRLREREYGSLDNDLDFLRKISPIYYIDRIVAPLLLIHGRNDPRVPVEESIQIYEKLKSLNRDVDIHIFEDEGHGVAKHRNRVIYIKLILDWISKYMNSI